MVPARFAPGDRVQLVARGDGATVWTVQKRDYWWTDTQPAYKLTAPASRSRQNIRYAFQSEIWLLRPGHE